ncbi:hypothetical protein MMC29_005212 [Sticta canariensis]|nr:hypothetical protein [Sticta canariensis]
MAFQKEEIDRYVFHRDHRASFRLNHNHWMIKELCGYLLHPKIQYDKSNVRVADIGTGTGIWALELANELSSSARIDGFDISPGQFTPQAWCGNNVHLLTHDAFKPFPTEYLGQYDIVHIRFFCQVANDEDAEPLLKNLITLLKPGGYLMWFEPLFYAGRTVVADPSTSAVAAESLVKLMQNPKPTSSYTWVEQLPISFSKNGLHLESYEKIPIPDRYRLIRSQSILATLEDLTGDATVDRGVKPEEARKFVDALDAEFAQGVSVDLPYFCVVGRKEA